VLFISANISIEGLERERDKGICSAKQLTAGNPFHIKASGNTQEQAGGCLPPTTPKSTCKEPRLFSKILIIHNI